MERMRWVKSEEEISVMRRAAELTDLALEALVEGLRPGMAERDLPALMQAAVQPHAGQLELCYLASTPMRAPQVCVPAQNLSSRRLQKGDVIITEIGAVWKGYAGKSTGRLRLANHLLPSTCACTSVALAHTTASWMPSCRAHEGDVLMRRRCCRRRVQHL
jgi:methionine aminopeptidase